MTLVERLRRLDDRVLPRLMGGAARPGDTSTPAEVEVSRFRFLTLLYAALAALQVVLLLADGGDVSGLQVALAVGFAACCAYHRVLWRRAVAAAGR